MPISKSAQVVIRTWYNFEYTAVCRMPCAIKMDHPFRHVHTYPPTRISARTNRAWIIETFLEWRSRRSRTSPLVGKEEIIREGLACPLF